VGKFHVPHLLVNVPPLCALIVVATHIRGHAKFVKKKKICKGAAGQMILLGGPDPSHEP